MLETNVLIPNLKCTAPCKECYELNGVTLDMDYCTLCWEDNPNKFLYELTEYKADGSGVSTCDNECPAGFTTNGDRENFICTNCDSKCAECLDDGNEGDMYKCTVCKPGWKIYAPDQTCMQTCGTGYYEVNSETCDRCSAPCMDCYGDKFNCIQCDASSTTNSALFTSIMISNNVETFRSDCRADCPSGYFLDTTDP